MIVSLPKTRNQYSFKEGVWRDDKRGTSLYTDLNTLLSKKLGDGITL
jgi:frataxin-like iron-binding protein CyaY